MFADSIVWLLVVQTVQVAAVAGLVGVFVRIFATDRPHLAHALWTLVLLKAITPPVFASPTSPFSWLGASHDYAIHSTATVPIAISSVSAIPPDMTIEWRISETMPVDALVHRNGVQSGISLKPYYSPALNAASMIVLFWAAGCICVATITAIRIRLFVTRVRNSTVRTPEHLSQTVQRLSKRLGLNRQVRIKVVDCGIGPAVIGLFRPTLLLPKIIVDQQSSGQLEPLVAHELVHIRRGDLCWALVQSMSVCVCWFHPLVWLAQRLVTRESELSCDEETIASLNCSPAVYARSLLNVLEQKQLLHAAPSLPGIRPVDVTANRMERIMRLGHGCHARSPWWVAATLLVGAACTLPGAALVIGQESDSPVELPNDSTQQEASGARPEKPVAPIDVFIQDSRNGRIVLGGTVDSDLGVAGQMLVDERQLATPANFKETLRMSSVVYQARNLLTGDQPMDVQLNDIAKLIKESIAPDSWIERGGMASLLIYSSNQSIVVYQNGTEHERICDLLDSLEKVANEKRYSVDYDVSEILIVGTRKPNCEQLDELCEIMQQTMVGLGTEKFNVSANASTNSIKVKARKNVHNLIVTYLDQLRNARRVFARIDG